MTDLHRISQSNLINSDFEQDKIEINKQLIQPISRVYTSDGDHEDEDENNNDDNNNIFNFSNKCLNIKYLPEIIAIICLVYIIQDFFTYEEFFKQCLSFQEWFQLNQSDFYLGFNQFISYFCMVCMLIQIFYLIAFDSKRLDAVSFTLYFVVCIGFFSIMKLIYHQLRPYMVTTQIHAYECAVEFGNPSGHAMMCSFCFTTFPYAINKNFYTFKKDQQSDKFSVKKILICIFNFTYIILVMLARIGVGVHSLNQVILGFVYGLLFSVVYIEFLNTYINNQIRYINSIERRGWFKYAGIVNLLYVGFIGALIGIYYLSKNSISEGEKNKAAYEIQGQAICDQFRVLTLQEIQNSASFLYNKCFVDSGIISAVFGGITAFILTEAQVQNNVKKYKSQLKKLSLLDILLRIMIQFLPALIFLLSIYIITHQFLNYDTFMAFLVQGIVGFYFTGFIVFYLSPIILKSCKLEVAGDYLVLSQNLNQSQGIYKNKLDHDVALDENDKRLTVLQCENRVLEFEDNKSKKKTNGQTIQMSNSQNESYLKNSRKIQFEDQQGLSIQTSMNKAQTDDDSERDSNNKLEQK